MSKVAVVHYLGATKRSRSVVASLVADVVDKGHDVSVVDISHFNTISHDLPPAWIVRLLGQKTYGDQLRKAFLRCGASYHRPQAISDSKETPPEESWVVCLQALDSELLTYFRVSSLIPESRAIRRMRRILANNALETYRALSAWLSEHKPDQVMIPNGRTSRQRMARVAAEEQGVDIVLYENGRAKKNSYYLGTTQPHDRISSQAEVAPCTATMSPTEMAGLATQWLAEKMDPHSDTNSFSSRWDQAGQSKNSSGSKPVAVFFHSSTDEFLAFGPMWHLDEWESQFHAFDLMMSILERKNCDLVLRLHPNLAEKSRSYFLETVQGVQELQKRHPLLTVHWHNSPVNSYDLAASADYVIVERSTIGLEANLMGKPVWVTQAAQWDVVADIRQALKPDDISEDFLEPWVVDTAGAERFVAYWMMQEHPLRYSWSDWATWDPDSAPLVLRIATLFTKNPLSHKVHLIRNAVTVWRNNRFAL